MAGICNTSHLQQVNARSFKVSVHDASHVKQVKAHSLMACVHSVSHQGKLFLFINS
jgi:hypothetical protein